MHYEEIHQILLHLDNQKKGGDGWGMQHALEVGDMVGKTEGNAVLRRVDV